MYTSTFEIQFHETILLAKHTDIFLFILFDFILKKRMVATTKLVLWPDDTLWPAAHTLFNRWNACSRLGGEFACFCLLKAALGCSRTVAGGASYLVSWCPFILLVLFFQCFIYLFYWFPFLMPIYFCSMNWGDARRESESLAQVCIRAPCLPRAATPLLARAQIPNSFPSIRLTIRSCLRNSLRFSGGIR